VSANRWLELLQIDHVGRRAIDETRLDWIEESRAARTPLARLVVAMHYSAAIVSVTTRVSLRQSWQGSASLLAVIVAGCVLLPALVWTAIAVPVLWPNPYWFDRSFAVLPGTVLTLIPIGGFFAALLSRRLRSRAPLAGLIVGMAVVCTAAVFMLTPASDRYLALMFWLRDARAGAQAPIAFAGSSFVQVLRAIVAGLASIPGAWYAWLPYWVPLTISAVILGGAFDRRSMRARRLAGLVAVPVYLLTLLELLAGFQFFWLLDSDVDHVWALVMTAMVLLFAWLTVGRSGPSIAHPPQSPPAPSPPPHRSARSAP
jgi:hypothetical protein